MARPNIVFHEQEHRYLVDGKELPSVTTVLGVLGKPALAPWAAKMTVEGVAGLIVKRRLPGVSTLVRALNALASREKSVYRRKKVILPALRAYEENPTDVEVLRDALAVAIKRTLAHHKLDHYSATDDSIVRGWLTINGRRATVTEVDQEEPLVGRTSLRIWFDEPYPDPHP